MRYHTSKLMMKKWWIFRCHMHNGNKCLYFQNRLPDPVLNFYTITRAVIWRIWRYFLSDILRANPPKSLKYVDNVTWRTELLHILENGLVYLSMIWLNQCFPNFLSRDKLNQNQKFRDSPTVFFFILFDIFGKKNFDSFRGT